LVDLFAKITNMIHKRLPAIIGFYGYSKSGKTTLINSLISKLKTKGISSAVIKETDKPIRVEEEGKDSLSFRISGAFITAFSSKLETNFTINAPIQTERIIDVISLLSDVDLVFVEGASSPAIPKIRLGEKPLRENTLLTYSGNIGDIETIIEKLLAERKEEVKDEN